MANCKLNLHNLPASTNIAQYSFGYGLSYTTFSSTAFSARSTSPSLGSPPSTTFIAGSNIIFSTTITNTGSIAGSYVAQVYLLARVSAITRPLQELVAFNRVYLEAGETRTVEMELEVDRYLPILDRRYEWVLEKGLYTFALMEHSGWDADRSVNVTLECV